MLLYVKRSEKNCSTAGDNSGLLFGFCIDRDLCTGGVKKFLTPIGESESGSDGIGEGSRGCIVVGGEARVSKTNESMHCE